MAKRKIPKGYYFEIPDPIVWEKGGRSFDLACKNAVTNGCNALIWEGRLYTTEGEEMKGNLAH